MESNRISNALRNKGVEVVFSYSKVSWINASTEGQIAKGESWSFDEIIGGMEHRPDADTWFQFGENSEYAIYFFSELAKGATVGQAAQHMKVKTGWWEVMSFDTGYVSYLYDAAVQGAPFPIFTSNLCNSLQR